MGCKLNDFSELKSLKMDFHGGAPSWREDSAAVPGTSKSHPGEKIKTDSGSGHNLAQRKELRPGCRVTLMDSNDRGVVRRVFDGYAEIEIDGLLFTAGSGEFVINNPDEDENLMKSMGKTALKRDSKPESVPSALPKEITVDLHLEKIPSGRNVPSGAELLYQMEYFRRVMRENLRHRGMKIDVVHGVGDGILRDAIRREIDMRYALSCFWTPGPAGVTIVTIR